MSRNLFVVPDLPTCSGCGEEIIDTAITAFGMQWHPNHLACKVCGKDFSDGSKVEEGTDGYAYCTADYVDVFAPKCAACLKPVIGEVVKAMDKTWHKTCFVCQTCKKPFEGSFFPTPEGGAFCETDYYASQGLLCQGCQKPILTGKCVKMGAVRYHPDHFVCSYCKKKLVGGQYHKQNDKPYCKNCHVMLYG